MSNPLKSDVKKLYWFIVIAGFLSALGFAIYHATQNKEIGFPWFWSSVCVNLCITLAIGILALMIQRAKDVSRKEDWNEHIVQPILTELGDVVQCLHTFPEIQWDKLFERTDEIDFVVQSWDKWEENVRVPLRSFLQRGGKINLFLHHHSGQFSETLHKPWQQRTNRNEQQAYDEIVRTIDSIVAAIHAALPGEKEAKREKRLTIRLMKNLNWFCAIRFGSDRLLLSVYAHHHRNGVEAPFFLIRTDSHKGIATWFQNELDQLITDSDVHQFTKPVTLQAPAATAKTE